LEMRETKKGNHKTNACRMHHASITQILLGHTIPVPVASKLTPLLLHISTNSPDEDTHW